MISTLELYENIELLQTEDLGGGGGVLRQIFSLIGALVKYLH